MHDANNQAATRITVSSAHPAKADVDVLIVPIRLNDALEHLPVSLRRPLRQRMRQLSFNGGWGAAELFPLSARGVRAPFVAVVGLGSAKLSPERQAEGMRRGVARVVQEMSRAGLHEAVLALHGPSGNVQRLATAAVDGALMASYRFTEYSARARRDARSRQLRRLTLSVSSADVAPVRQEVEHQQALLTGVELTRNLVNRPAADVTPAILVAAAQTIKRQSRRISLRILDRREAAEVGLNAFLAVARGSAEEPYVIHLTYTPPRRHSLKHAAEKAPARIFLIGKGITFDSGGLSIKPADYMESMKIDMAGAATVLGVFSVLARLKLGVEVHGVIAACENMPSGAAYRPGDILTAKNGKTIEVLNTDAEGRITLADALGYAADFKPDVIIDVATLTGACMVALGETHAGLWSTDAALARQLLTAAGAAGEGLVRLPLPEEYRPMIESKVADVRNLATSKWGGAITAALFLREFSGNVPWAHIDIAGPAYAEREWLPYHGVGATGYGVRTLTTFLEQR
jgi:leucyl aminopeptidase